MAVQNNLVAKKENQMTIRYMAGEEEVKLSPTIVKKYLVSGNPEKITDQEIVMFMNLCKYQHLNPFLKEAYCIKYGNSPATIVTGKAALEKRANRCEGYEGFEAGVIVITAKGEIEKRVGTLVINGETLVGGWCDVWVSRFKKPVSVTVSLNEYISKKADGSINAQWSGKPATMIRKVAKVQALREAFPEDFEGMYSAEEMGVNENEIDANPMQEQPQPQIQPQPEIINSAPTANAPEDSDFQQQEFEDFSSLLG